MVFDCAGKGPKKYAVTRAWLDDARPAFPAVNLEVELHGARVWIAANPTRRKTFAGMPRFLTTWFSRAQNRGGSSFASPTAQGRADNRCTWHQRPGNDNTPSAYPKANCERCRHFKASALGRVSEPMPTASLAKPHAPWSDEQKREAAEARAGRKRQASAAGKP
jgi:hypothetical protein